MDELVGDTLFLLFTVTLPTGVASYLYKVDQIELHWAVVLTPFAVAALVAISTGIPIESRHVHGREGILVDMFEKFAKAFGGLFFLCLLVGLGAGLAVGEHQRSKSA